MTGKKIEEREHADDEAVEHLGMNNPLLKRLALGVLLFVVVYGATSWYVVGQWQNAGVFGDMFGAVNALFAGLAFAAVAVSIFQQSRQLEMQRKELRLQRKELSLQREELTLAREQLEKSAEANTASAQFLGMQQELVERKALSEAQGDFRNLSAVVGTSDEQTIFPARTVMITVFLKNVGPKIYNVLLKTDYEEDVSELTVAIIESGDDGVVWGVCPHGSDLNDGFYADLSYDDRLGYRRAVRLNLKGGEEVTLPMGFHRVIGLPADLKSLPEIATRSWS